MIILIFSSFFLAICNNSFTEEFKAVVEKFLSKNVEEKILTLEFLKNKREWQLNEEVKNFCFIALSALKKQTDVNEFFEFVWSLRYKSFIDPKEIECVFFHFFKKTTVFQWLPSKFEQEYRKKLKEMKKRREEDEKSFFEQMICF